MPSSRSYLAGSVVFDLGWTVKEGRSPWTGLGTSALVKLQQYHNRARVATLLLEGHFQVDLSSNNCSNSVGAELCRKVNWTPPGAGFAAQFPRESATVINIFDAKLYQSNEFKLLSYLILLGKAEGIIGLESLDVVCQLADRYGRMFSHS